MKLRFLYTPEVMEQIQLLAAQGLRPIEIAKRIGCSPGTLKVMCCRANISLRRVPYEPISLETAGKLKAHADKKGMSPVTLITRLLEAIARDDLFDAVLDPDEKETPLAMERAE